MKSFVFVLAVLAAVAFAVEYPRYNSAWFVLICGTSGWDEYATEASFYKLYHVLHDLGIPDRRIVTFFSDNIAYDDHNYFPGEVYNANYHEGGHNENVYEGMLKDYTGSNASQKNLLNVLNGLPTTGGSGKVLQSTESDNVFIFYVGDPCDYYGYQKDFFLHMPSGWIYQDDFSNAISNMTTNKMYNKLFVYVMAGHSYHMLNKNAYIENAYLVSSRGDTDPITRSNYDPFISNYVSRHDIGNFTEYLEEHGFDFTVEDLYASGLHNSVELLADCQYGDSLMKNMTFRDFVWNKDFKYHTKPVYMHNHPPFNVPGRPFCTSCSTSCDCYAICKIRGYTDQRCSDLCCEPSSICFNTSP